MSELPDLEAVEAFVSSIALPDYYAPMDAEDMRGADDFTHPDYQKPDLAVTIGSQIASFAEEIDASTKEHIANAFLFAQQAADKQIASEPEASSNEWYAAYTDVLGQIGWTIQGRTAATRTFKGNTASLHKAIIPVLTTAIAPVAGAAPLVVQILDSLQEMDSHQPWITLFSSASRRAKANQFQIAHVDQNAGAPRIKLIAFELSAKRIVTQVLFVKLATSEAELEHFESTLSVNQTVFSAASPIIQERLSDRVAEMVLAIEI